MNRLDRKPRSAARRTRRALDAQSRLIELLDDDDVGGLLARIRAVGGLLGAAAHIDPAQISAAGWLIEALAEEAQVRLRAAVQQPAPGAAVRMRRRP